MPQVNRYAPACFQAQQAAEKAVKAYLHGRGERVVIDQLVAGLLRRTGQWGEELKSLEADGAFLDGFGILARYPNGLPCGTPATAFRNKDAAEAMASAGKSSRTWPAEGT
jgi:HEPN domain-containing protein